METTPHFVTYLDSPIGIIELTASSEAIETLCFVEEKKFEENSNTLLNNCVQQLKEYFEGNRKNFDLPLTPDGTAFQQSVWKELLTVPFGKTASYLDIAKILGDKNATRAVGGANGQNPISIIIPCHRVIGSNGKLTGYGGGIHRKKWLLDFEHSAYQQKLF